MTMNINDTATTQTVIVQGGTTTLLAAYFYQAIYVMIPYLIAAIIIIGVDLYFGILAARYHREQVRFSRAIRRTFNKVCEYFCWVMLSATLSISFNAVWLQYVILSVVMGNELTSVFSNYCEAHGKRIKGFNIFKIIGRKIDVDLNDVTIEDIKTQDNGKNKNND